MRRTAALVAAVLAVASAPAYLAPVAAFGDTVPYSDPAATGTLTLCDTRGQVATGGSVNTKPFVWRAVGSTAAPGDYARTGRTAALYGYQPIRDVQPVQWNGEYLTASARYTSASRPMAAATASDPSLADLLSNYPPRWDGLMQLRMFVGVPGLPTLTTPYNAATIRISGDTWTLVSGGRDGCTSGQARSAELVLPSVAALGTPSPNATTDAPVKHGAVSGSGTSGSGTRASAPSGSGSSGAAPGGASDGSQPSSTPAAAAAAATDNSGTTGWAIALIAVALLAAGLGLLVVLRRRGASRHSTPGASHAD